MPHIFHYHQGRFSQERRPVVEELPLTIEVNGQELATLLTSPFKLDFLVLGFLYFERIIGGLEDIETLAVDVEEGLAEVELKVPFTPPPRRVFTSGCTGGVTFHLSLQDYPPVDSRVSLEPEAIFPLMKALYEGAEHYKASRGIHAAALCDRARVLIVAEDVGRHNALDKILGEALFRGIETEGRLLLSSGRISSEMLRKGARMRVPFIISRTSPTSLAVELAKRLGITLIGYVRGQTFNVYSHPERIAYRRPRGPEAARASEPPLKVSVSGGKGPEFRNSPHDPEEGRDE